MALVVEDGTGLANADAYASIAEADTYNANFGNAAWADAESEDKEAAIRKATRYLDSAYRYAGTKTNRDQALQWPRTGVVVDGYELEDDDVPTVLKNATAQTAFLALTEDLTPSLARGGQVKSEQVDVIAITYMDGAPAGTTFSVIDYMMRPLVYSSSVVKVVRA